MTHSKHKTIDGFQAGHLHLVQSDNRSAAITHTNGKKEAFGLMAGAGGHGNENREKIASLLKSQFTISIAASSYPTPAKNVSPLERLCVDSTCTQL